jgi:hypothetical protein
MKYETKHAPMDSPEEYALCCDGWEPYAVSLVYEWEYDDVNRELVAVTHVFFRRAVA